MGFSGLTFTRQVRPGRIVFGAGRLDSLGEEVARLGAERVLLIASGSASVAAERAADLLGPRLAGRWGEVRRHVSVDVAERARKTSAEAGADAAVCIGGGSAVGVAKAIALTAMIPVVAVPTTYSGSEVTPVWGLTEGTLTEGSQKRTGVAEQVLPRTVIYDPMLTLSMPAGLSVTSGMNAMAHCVEALYAAGANPATSALAVDGVLALASGLGSVVGDPAGLDGRSTALYGAYLAGTVMAEAGTWFHHKLCHALGGMYDLPHAELHTILLPHSVAAVEGLVPSVLEPVAAALGASTAAGGLFDLSARLGAPVGLGSLGITLSQAAEAIPLVSEAMAGGGPVPGGPVPDGAAIEVALEGAFAGRRPGV
jgi:maleylacetate reductase